MTIGNMYWYYKKCWCWFLSTKNLQGKLPSGFFYYIFQL
jgi:hypothetical protein